MCKYIANSFKFFGEVRRDYEKLASQVSAGHCTSICFVGTGEIMEIAQRVFSAHNIEVVCVLDVLACEGEQHFQNFKDIPEEIVSQIDASSSQKLCSPTKHLKFWRRLRVSKRSWRQHL